MLLVTYDAPAADPALQFVDALCSLDADEAAAFLCEDAQLSIARGVLACGKARINKAFKRAIALLNQVQCRPAAVWFQGGVGIIEADVSCERLDGSRALFPITLVLFFRDHLVVDIRLFTYEPACARAFLS